MSEKKWKFDSRVPHKERGGRRGKGSGFPRHGMNEYDGERLAMGRHRFPITERKLTTRDTVGHHCIKNTSKGF